jgi:hypothetical protein
MFIHKRIKQWGGGRERDAWFVFSFESFCVLSQLWKYLLHYPCSCTCLQVHEDLSDLPRGVPLDGQDGGGQQPSGLPVDMPPSCFFIILFISTSAPRSPCSTQRWGIDLSSPLTCFLLNIAPLRTAIDLLASKYTVPADFLVATSFY